jgi:hypothetical protein
MAFFLTLFTPDTWQSFRRHGATVNEFRERQFATANRANPGCGEGVKPPCLEFSEKGDKKLLGIAPAEIVAHANPLKPQWIIIVDQVVDEASQREAWHA